MFSSFFLYVKNIIIYFAIIQSFFLAAHFYTNKQLKSFPNKILGLLILLFGISVLASQLFIDRSISIFYNSKWILYARILINLLLIVLLYFHIHAIASKDFALRKKSNLLVLLSLIVSILYLQIIFNATPWPTFDFNFFIRISILNLIFNSIYLGLIFIILTQQFRSFKNYFTLQTNPNRPWISFITGTFIFLLFSEVVQLIMLLTKNFIAIYPYLVYIYTIVPFLFINTILFFVLKKPKLFVYKRNGYSNLKSNKNKLIGDFLHLLEHDKIYTDPELSLTKVANRINVNPKYLSAEINDNLNQSFIDLINVYRISESKKMLIAYPDKTIQEIMFTVGYNSKSAFNSHFKKDTGLTPKEYRIKKNV